MEATLIQNEATAQVLAQQTEKKDYSKIVLPMSGGIVSTTLAYYLKEKGYNVHPITFDWGQWKQAKNLEGIKRTCEKLNFPLKVIDLYSVGNLLRDAGKDQQVVMNRDLIYLSIAISYALTIKSPTIYYPVYLINPEHADPIGRYAENLRSIVKNMTADTIRLNFDFWMNEEWEVIELGDLLGVPFENTWSCFFNEETHCGKCPGCENRKNAFNKTALKDETIYKE